MFGLEGCTNAYRYCTNNWKPIAKQVGDYIIAMTPIVNLIFLQYRSNHAQTNINSPEIRQNILHFFQVTKTCSRLTFITGIFLYIYGTRVNKHFSAVALMLFSSSVITAKLLTDIEMRFDREDDGLALFNLEWVSLLNSEARLWLNKLCLDYPLIEKIITPQRDAKLAEFHNRIEMEFPIKLVKCRRQMADDVWYPALCLLLCRTDQPDQKALVVLTIDKIGISGSAWMYDKEIKNLIMDALFPHLFPHADTPYGSDEFKEQTKSLALLLGGESIRYFELCWLEEDFVRGIDWTLEHYDDTKNINIKSARKA